MRGRLGPFCRRQRRGRLCLLMSLLPLTCLFPGSSLLLGQLLCLLLGLLRHDLSPGFRNGTPAAPRTAPAPVPHFFFSRGSSLSGSLSVCLLLLISGLFFLQPATDRVERIDSTGGGARALALSTGGSSSTPCGSYGSRRVAPHVLHWDRDRDRDRDGRRLGRSRRRGGSLTGFAPGFCS